MVQEGMLSILRRGTAYQVRYASSNPYDRKQQSCTCANERALVTLLALRPGALVDHAGCGRTAAREDGDPALRLLAGPPASLLRCAVGDPRRAVT